MKKSIVIYLTLFALCLILCQSCQKKGESGVQSNAVYYWRTTLRLDDAEKAFLKDHNVTKMYLRFFDVVPDYDCGAIPNGTLIFNDTLPEGLEIVPTVFIDGEAIKSYSEYKDKLLNRICAMAEINNITFNEIQIDCDWTKSGRDSYFAFMKEFREILKEKGLKLSATIRCFQLNDTPPAADYGVLMCYNTGDIESWYTTNSIIDIEDIKRYIKALKKYDLPLSVALPTYSWNLAFNSEKEFLQIRYNTLDFSDRAEFEDLGSNCYMKIFPPDKEIYPWDECFYRHEDAPIDVLLKVKELVEANLRHPVNQTVIYELDSDDLTKYSKNEIDKIYR